jgi:hypothetical protein
LIFWGLLHVYILVWRYAGLVLVEKLFLVGGQIHQHGLAIGLELIIHVLLKLILLLQVHHRHLGSPIENGSLVVLCSEHPKVLLWYLLGHKLLGFCDVFVIVWGGDHLVSFLLLDLVGGLFDGDITSVWG